MGYTKIIGTPLITGLYTLVLPVVAFAVLGSSRHLVVGADSATAAIVAAGLAGVAALGSPEYVALTSTVAMLAGTLILLREYLTSVFWRTSSPALYSLAFCRAWVCKSLSGKCTACWGWKDRRATGS